MTVLKLFLLVVSLTAVSFGGGQTLSAGLEHELVGGGYLSPAQFAGGMALGQSTPGPMAAFTTAIGNNVLGFPGAAVATLALVVISLGAVVVIQRVPGKWFLLPPVRRAMALVPPYVVALVVLLTYRVVAGGNLERPVLPLLLIGVAAAGRLLKVSGLYLILGCVAVGMLVQGTGLAGW